MNNAIIKTCPIGCKGILEATDIILPEGALRRCGSCGQLVSSCTQERYDKTMQDFNSDAGTMPQGKSEKRHHKRIGNILNEAIRTIGYGVDDISFLDIGCSSGSVLNTATKLGIPKIYGVEPASKAAATAQGLGYNVFSGFLEDAKYPDKHFSLVSMFEVIEHLSEARSIAHEIHRILCLGGLWLIGTANAESWTANNLREQWEYFSIAQNGGHISFFNPRSMRKLAERQGFSVAYINTKRVLHTASKKRNNWEKTKDEAMAIPARISERGHDMLVALQKTS
ncbi:MAG: class I SAM-dependent methyltransferase [Mariprofundales bacterium]